MKFGIKEIKENVTSDLRACTLTMIAHRVLRERKEKSKIKYEYYIKEILDAETSKAENGEFGLVYSCNKLTEEDYESIGEILKESAFKTIAGKNYIEVMWGR